MAPARPSVRTWACPSEKLTSANRNSRQPERTDDSRRHAAGLGLGLYITRKIVSLHAGHIGVESAPGEGSRFVVDLPLHIPEADGDAAQPT